VQIGELRHVVTIEQPTGTISPTGGVIEGAPQTVATGVPMAITALDVQSMASEMLKAGGMQGTTVYTVRCRYREDFSGTAVLLEQCCRQRRLEIISLAPSDRNEALEMLCVERL
jgi:head-tail joining protein